VSGGQFLVDGLSERRGELRQFMFDVVAVQVDHVVVDDSVESHYLLRQPVELLRILHINNASPH